MIHPATGLQGRLQRCSTSAPTLSAATRVADSWLAAYALGLAYARADAEDFVPALAELASNDADLLAAAGVRLVRLPGADDPALARAQRLLGAAARAAQAPSMLR